MKYSILFKCLAALLVIALGAYPTPSSAADIYLKPGVSEPIIVIEGEFRSGDAQAFADLVKEQRGEVQDVELYSPGGNLREAISIGRLLRVLALGSRVPGGSSDGPPRCPAPGTPKDDENCLCASACFFAHVGSVNRGGNKIGVHRPYFDPEIYSGLSASDARDQHQRLLGEAREYLKEMDVPERIIETVFSTSPDKIKQIALVDIIDFFLGRVPYLHDWMNSKCGDIISDEVRREMDILWRKQDLSLIEKEFFDNHTSSWVNFNICEEDALKSARLEGYQEVFGVRPSEFELNVPVDVWIEAIDLIGRDFRDLEASGFVQSHPHQMVLLRSGLPEVAAVTPEGTDETRVASSFVSKHGVQLEYIVTVIRAITDRFGIGPAVRDDPLMYFWSVEGVTLSLYVRGVQDDHHLVLAVNKK